MACKVMCFSNLSAHSMLMQLACGCWPGQPYVHMYFKRQPLPGLPALPCPALPLPPTMASTTGCPRSCNFRWSMCCPWPTYLHAAGQAHATYLSVHGVACSVVSCVVNILKRYQLLIPRHCVS